MNELASGIQGGKIEATRADIDELRRLVEWANSLTQNPTCDIRPPATSASEPPREEAPQGEKV